MCGTLGQPAPVGDGRLREELPGRRGAGAPDDDARAALAVRTAAAREQLGSHLAHEETEALALAQRVLAPAEWNAALAASFGESWMPRRRGGR